jgi:hypothetical protein
MFRALSGSLAHGTPGGHRAVVGGRAGERGRVRVETKCEAAMQVIRQVTTPPTARVARRSPAGFNPAAAR